jgi:hypothetical protein
MPVSRSVGSHGYGDVWHVVPRCNDDQVQNHNYEHYSSGVRRETQHTTERSSNPTQFSFLQNIPVANERRGELELCFFRASGQLVLSFSRKIATIER